MTLDGEWIGAYPGHFDQVVKIEQRGAVIEARKITGDDFVPAGELTWKADLEKKEAFGFISEREGKNHRPIPGRLKVLAHDRLVFEWIALNSSVEFRRDDI